jgi:glycosyltransferase involved in cell wall biosynthesis
VVVTTEHGKNLWKTPIHHFIEKRIVSPLVTMRVAVSKDIRDIRVQSGDVPEDKITVITNCVETPENIRRNGPRKKVRIGTVGRLVPAKAYGTLITAFKRLKEVGLSTELIFVGDGGERSKLELMAQDLGIAEDITFTGFQADVNRFLANFDIFVLSSIREGIPVSMLEAMAMSVSVVATRVGGIPEVIEHNVDGLLVDSENTEMLSQALRRLVEDGLLRKRIGEAGRKKVTRLFSKEAICRQYENLYRTLLRAVD